MKTFWTKQEISIGDELMSFADNLREEFLAHHKDYHTTFKGGKSYASANPLACRQLN